MSNANTKVDTSIVTHNGNVYLAPQSTINTDQRSFLLDEDWAKSSFLISDLSFDANSVDLVNRYWSSANAKFTDGRLGCNIGINPKPQFTRYTDIRVGGRIARNKVSLSNTEGNYGMGRYYSEAIDDPSQTVYMRLGVPQFNSLSNFIRNAFSGEMTTLARTGKSRGVLYSVGKWTGTAIAVMAFPTVAAFVAGARILNWLFSRPTSKFYTLKPTMHTYWSTVNTMVMDIAVLKGILPKTFADGVIQDDPNKGERLGNPYKLDQDHINHLAELMPDVFTDGVFDVFAIANKAQRLANAMFNEEYNALNNGTSTDYYGYLKKDMGGKGSHSTGISATNNRPTLVAWLNKVTSISYYLSKDGDSQTERDPRISDELNDPNDPNSGMKKKDPGFFESLYKNFDSEFRDGSQFAVFKVNHSESVSESFGNSVQESDLSQKINGMSSQAKQARFTFAEGNLVGESMAGAAVQGLLGAAKDVVDGVLDGVTFGISELIRGVAGSGYIDIPKHYQSSTANLSRISYTMDLISPYGNVMSQMQNIYIPLSMILAASLPLSTGKQSYTSPFICQIYDRGRQQIKLGMVESLSITRGTTNLMFNTKGSAMGIKVTFTVVDLSSIMHMPISKGSIFGNDVASDEDNILVDYLATLAGQDLYSQLYAMPKAKLKLARKLAALKKLQSPAYWASYGHEWLKENIITGPVVNVLEGLNRGSGTAKGPTFE